MVPNGGLSARVQLSPYMNGTAAPNINFAYTPWTNYLSTLAKLSQSFSATHQNFESNLQHARSQLSTQKQAEVQVNQSHIKKLAISSTHCEICNQDFKNPRGLKQHKGKMHENDEKKTSCSVCFKPFKNKYALKSHISQVHEKVTKVECPECHKMIYNKYVLSKHIESKHSK